MRFQRAEADRANNMLFARALGGNSEEGGELNRMLISEALMTFVPTPNIPIPFRSRQVGGRVYPNANRYKPANYSYGTPSDPTWLGETDWYGNVTIQPTLTGQDLTETVRHEFFHSSLRVRKDSLCADFRANLNRMSYEGLHSLKFAEEFGAELYATGSINRALELTKLYQLSNWRITTEAFLYTGAVGGTSYGLYAWRR